MPFQIYPAHSALLSMDLQVSTVPFYVKDPGFFERARAVLARARGNGMRVIHVRVGFHPGWPEASSRNKLFDAISRSPQRRAMFEGERGEIHRDVAPQPGEVLITKHRVSAFAGTDLDMILRANDVDTIVMFGIATSGVVLSTLLHAADADYRVAVIGDCCADLDPEIHACLVGKIFPQQATVIPAAEFLAATLG